MSNQRKELMSPKEAAEFLGKNRHTVSNWIRLGHVPASMIGNRAYLSIEIVKQIRSGTYRKTPEPTISGQ